MKLGNLFITPSTIYLFICSEIIWSLLFLAIFIFFVSCQLLSWQYIIIDNRKSRCHQRKIMGMPKSQKDSLQKAKTS